MSDKKQTAVEWLISEMPVINWQDPYWEIKLKKAKELQKQQIIDAYDLGMGHYGNANCRSDAEQYYQETYKNQ